MYSNTKKEERDDMQKKNIMLKLADVLLGESQIAPEERNQIMRLLKEESDE